MNPRFAMIRFSFLIAVLLLVSAVVGFRILERTMNVVLHKESVNLRHGFSDLPLEVGQWRRVGTDKIMSAEVTHELGTDIYLDRDYAIDGKTTNGVLNLHVAYYTGMVDAVPHIPERCFVGGGFERRGGFAYLALPLDTSEWQPDAFYDPSTGGGDESEGPYMMARSRNSESMVPMPRLNNGQLNLNISEYGPPGRPDWQLTAGYFFIASGWATASSERVRLHAFNRNATHAYYCKVQFTLSHPQRPTTKDELAEVATEFLDVMLPELMWCLPDWRQVQQNDSENGTAALVDPGG